MGESSQIAYRYSISTHSVQRKITPAMTDQELKDLVASLAVKSDRLDAQLAQTNEQIAKTDAQVKSELAETQRVLKEVSRRMGAMASNQGDVAEEFFYNSLREKMELGGIEFDTIFGNFVVGDRKRNSELDILMVNGQSAALIEVKYKAHMNGLDQVAQKVADYRSLRPEHKDYKLYAGLAGFSVPQDVAEEAHRRGMFVLKRKGDLVETEASSMRAF
jgi:multidrug efflux pump subunit AcrA (membrane-fusion protein)